MVIFTDGACQKNGQAQNTGGFGVVVVDDTEQNLLFCYSKLSENTTNNREELKAILYTLLNYGYLNGETATVYSDSNYCVQTFNEWMFSWARNGWIKSDKKTPENLDLIKEYYNYINKGYRINLKKIKGHAGHKWNELADKLATGSITMRQAYERHGVTMPNYQSLIEEYHGR